MRWAARAPLSFSSSANTYQELIPRIPLPSYEDSLPTPALMKTSSQIQSAISISHLVRISRTQKSRHRRLMLMTYASSSPPSTSTFLSSIMHTEQSPYRLMRSSMACSSRAYWTHHHSMWRRKIQPQNPSRAIGGIYLALPAA